MGNEVDLTYPGRDKVLLTFNSEGQDYVHYRNRRFTLQEFRDYVLNLEQKDASAEYDQLLKAHRGLQDVVMEYAADRTEAQTLAEDRLVRIEARDKELRETQKKLLDALAENDRLMDEISEWVSYTRTAVNEDLESRIRELESVNDSLRTELTAQRSATQHHWDLYQEAQGKLNVLRGNITAVYDTLK